MQQQMMRPFPSAADSVDSENPFDFTWGVLKALKAEVRELQAALHAEQHKREQEVFSLQRDLQACKDDLAKERAERVADSAKRAAEMEGEHARVSEDLRQTKAFREDQIRSMNEAMEDVKKGHAKDVQDLLNKLKAEETSRDKSTKHLAETLDETRRSLDVSGRDSRECIHKLGQDVRLISDQLSRVNNTWISFRSDSLLSRTMQPMQGPTSPRQYPFTGDTKHLSPSS
eukprot:CAMPEP_0171188804 /NCGR_PEP_ID=MMETSP0790-20130122/18021_1 /TAXON_ID=2925 /ORGANISM="Alexandrium catenella, Strain OF101" /LENGTH=228 /DNA_ID=CAMNT_0011653899 /DNA_START=171 /DNA_END=857 /DNA_ORIENTATION=+